MNNRCSFELSTCNDSNIEADFSLQKLQNLWVAIALTLLAKNSHDFVDEYLTANTFLSVKKIAGIIIRGEIGELIYSDTGTLR